jgi:hypothetical protein
MCESSEVLCVEAGPHLFEPVALRVKDAAGVVGLHRPRE